MTETAEINIPSLVDEANRLAQLWRMAEAMALLEPHADTSADAASALGYLLIRSDRSRDAITLLAPWAEREDAGIGTMTAFAFALKSAGMVDEAIACYRRIVEKFPTEGLAEHNLAAALGDEHYFAEAERATARAFAKKFDHPHTWLTRARAFAGLDRPDDAERAYRQVLARYNRGAEAQGELAQHIWMATGNDTLALKELDAARTQFPQDAGLARARARFLEAIGREAQAYATLVKALQDGADPMLDADAAVYSLKSDPEAALAHARRALKLAPEDEGVLAALCQAQLAVGDGAAALATADQLCARWPQDQLPVALRGTALRLLGDDRYRELYDYEPLVKHRPIETPEGWSSLDAYLVDLAAGLEGLHHHQAHPIGQSLRNGAQTPRNLKRSENPAIQAFFPALEQSIADYIAGAGNALGWSGEPRVNGAWSVRLKPNGFHINHLHPRGVISSAFHVTVPDTVEQGHEGWLAFGQPGVPTRPALEAEHFIKPRPGWLALFPSYMWHGTVPFSGEGVRLTMAFDVIAT